MARRYKPVYGMDRGARLWLYRTAQKNFWRVSSWYDLDDLVQDGFVQYNRIVNKYPHITARAHLMGLFQRTYINHIHDLAKRRSRLIEYPESSLIRDGEQGSPFDIPDLPASDLLAKAPEVVHRLLAVVQTEEGRRALRALYRVRSGGTRETVNQRLARLTGLPDSTDFEGVFRGYLSADGDPPVAVGRRLVDAKCTRQRSIAWVGEHLTRLGCSPEQVARHTDALARQRAA